MLLRKKFTTTFAMIVTNLGSIICLALFPVSVGAQVAAVDPVDSSVSNPFVIIMIIVMVILLLFIGLLANIVSGSAGLFRERQVDEHEKGNGNKIPSPAVKVIASAILLFCNSMAFAGEPVVATQRFPPYAGLAPTAFYFLWSVLAVEMLVIFFLLATLRTFMRREQALSPAKHSIKIDRRLLMNFWNKLNSFKAADKEKDIEMDHEYDGIRELDNRLPPWWLYGFYLSIVVAGIYMYRYHVSYSAPLPIEELQIAMAKAAVDKQAYLKKSANLVDETTVKMISNPQELSGGKKMFEMNCGACHGSKGEGIVGPNLTDEYWLHGGGISDVFKSIKYGWPEKGMKSWKDDFSPSQLAQLASFIKTLKGSNPANAKARQGELFVTSDNDKEPAKSDSVIQAATITKS